MLLCKKEISNESSEDSLDIKIKNIVSEVLKEKDIHLLNDQNINTIVEDIAEDDADLIKDLF